MGWSGRAPAPAASDACAGHQRQGARHGRSSQEFDRLRRHRHRQELVPRRRSRWARRHRAAAEVITWPGGSTVREYAAMSDWHGSLRRRAPSQPPAPDGHDARLMPARYVRPYSKGQKNDFRDAEAIAEAVQRPTMKFVATKTVDQLDLQAMHRVRERLVSQRTGIINQIRAFLLERGVAVRQGLRFLRAELPGATRLARCRR